MNIKVNHFCGLSSSSDFRTWLKDTAPDLLDQLVNNSKKGCRSKQEKMVQIHRVLYERGLGPKLEEFVKQRYPYMINTKSQTSTQSLTKFVPKTAPKQITQTTDHIEKLNKHRVFKHYRPDLLTFPHKHIMVAEPSKLLDMVKAFINDKVSVDYIIIEDHAYIEYFPRRYSDVAEEMKPENREIWIYRQRASQK